MPKEIVKFIEKKINVQGYVIGYEILQGGLTVCKHTYDKPVKNMIVNSGKDGWCARFGYYPDTGGTIPGQTVYAARGSGSTPTAATMEELESQIGNRTNQYLTGDPNTGTRYNRESGIVYMRRTYDFEIETSNQNINEVGLFPADTTNTATDSAMMFSRVVLPSTVTVLTDQQLRLTYEVQVTIGPVVSTPAAPTITGWTTDGDTQLVGAFPATSSVYTSTQNAFLSVINTSGGRVGPTNMYSSIEPGAVDGGSPYGETALTTDQSTFNPDHYGPWILPTAFWASSTLEAFGSAWNPPAVSPGVSGHINCWTSSPGSWNATLKAYTRGTFYRDRQIVLQANCPGVNFNFGAYKIAGLKHVFDAQQTKLTTQRLTLVLRISVA